MFGYMDRMTSAEYSSSSNNQTLIENMNESNTKPK